MALSLGSVNLDNITAGIPHFALADNGYQQAIATPPGDGSIPPFVTDVITVLAHGADADALAVLMQSLDAERVLAARYWADPTEAAALTPVWLQAQLSGETGARRALVKSVAVKQISPTFSPPAPKAWEVRLAVERHPYWERTTTRDWPEASPSAAAAITYDYTAAGSAIGAHDIVGDVSARIRSFFVDSNTAGFTFDRFWAGIRSQGKHWVVTNFVPVWECENGTNEAIAADNAVGDVNGASPGGGSGIFVRGTPTGDDTWEKYFALKLADISANEQDNFGHFLWLLRYKVDSSCTYEVQFRFGYVNMDDADFIRGPIVEVTNTNWDYVEMGEARIPIRDLQGLAVGESSEAQWCIQVWAQRTAGASTIDFDCFCPITLDEGWLKVENIGSANPFGFIFGEHRSSRYSAMMSWTTGPLIKRIPTFSTNNFRLPIGDGLMSVVYARSDRSVLTDTIILGENDGGKYMERWISLRGAE